MKNPRRNLILIAGVLVATASTSSVSVLANPPVVNSAISKNAVQLNTHQFKTPFAATQKVQPFLDALETFDKDAAQHKGRGSADKLQRLLAASTQAKAEAKALATRLKANNEIDAFNQLSVEKAQSLGLNTLVVELQKAGGTYAVLTNMDRYLDDEIASRRKIAGANLSGIWYELQNIRVSQLLGIADAQAASLFCSVAVWALTMGQGTEANYKLCMGNAKR